jgi:hypothetical protein
LIVGDVPEQNELLSRIFLMHGWKVATALSLAETRDVLDSPPACLLAERVLYLPDGSVYDVVREVRLRSPAVRVVLIQNPRDLYDSVVYQRVQEMGLGLPADGSGSDTQYDAFFEACNRMSKRLLHEDLRPDVVLWCHGNAEEIVRACEPSGGSGA